MKTILMHNEYREEHLAAVIEQMRTLGAPTLRAVWIEAYGAWMLLEGCHRARAAKALGLSINIDAVEFVAEMTTTDLGLDCQDEMTMEELVDDAHRREMVEIAD